MPGSRTVTLRSSCSGWTSEGNLLLRACSLFICLLLLFHHALLQSTC